MNFVTRVNVCKTQCSKCSVDLREQCLRALGRRTHVGDAGISVVHAIYTYTHSLPTSSLRTSRTVVLPALVCEGCSLNSACGGTSPISVSLNAGV